MITEKLISMMETKADDLTRSWINMLRSNENTQTFQDIPDKALSDLSHFVYQQLRLWLDWQVTSDEVAQQFWEIGQRRKQEGIPLSSLHYAMVLARRNLYINILEKMGAEEDVDFAELIAFTSRITYFFDKTGYFVIRGYEGSQQPTAEDKSDLDNILAAFRVGSNPEM